MTNIDELREKIMPILKPYVSEVALFGSVARGEDTDQSDVDILVKLNEPIGLFTLVHLEQELSNQLRRPVDLLTEGAISPYIRPYLEKDKIVIYEHQRGPTVPTSHA